MAGIDTTKFSARSSRSASTSAAFGRDVPLDNILQAAGWSSQHTFSKFYCRPVLATHTKTIKSLAQSVLDKFVCKKNVKVTMLGDYVVICKFVVHMFPDAKVSCKYV